MIQKLKIVEFKFRCPDKQNQITKEERELDISNKFFKMCELSDEYEVISNNTNIICFFVLNESNAINFVRFRTIV